MGTIKLEERKERRAILKAKKAWKNNGLRFGGRTNDFFDSKDRNQEKKHLKAFLKGSVNYRFGFDLNGVPEYFQVLRIK